MDLTPRAEMQTPMFNEAVTRKQDGPLNTALRQPCDSGAQPHSPNGSRTSGAGPQTCPPPAQPNRPCLPKNPSIPLRQPTKPLDLIPALGASPGTTISNQDQLSHGRTTGPAGRSGAWGGPKIGRSIRARFQGGPPTSTPSSLYPSHIGAPAARPVLILLTPTKIQRHLPRRHEPIRGPGAAGGDTLGLGFWGLGRMGRWSFFDQRSAMAAGTSSPSVWLVSAVRRLVLRVWVGVVFGSLLIGVLMYRLLSRCF